MNVAVDDGNGDSREETKYNFSKTELIPSGLPSSPNFGLGDSSQGRPSANFGSVMDSG